MDNLNNSKIPLRTSSKWFFFISLFIIFDYSRIYDMLHLGVIRPLMMINFVFIYFIFISGEYHRVKSKQITLMWLFCFLLGCHIMFARNNYYAYATTRNQFLFMPFILSTIICIDTLDRLKKFINICIYIEIYIALYGLTHGGLGPGNYFADENDLCLYINMWLPFCYFLFLYEKKMKYKMVYLAGLIVGLLSVVATFSRGGFVGLVAMIIAIIAFSKKKVLALTLIAVSGMFLFFYAEKAYWDDMSTITNTEDSTVTERLLSWGAAWRMFLDNPLGVGGNNFQIQFPRYQSKEHTRQMWGRVAHSLWFTLIPELGILGVYIYFSLLYYNIKDIFSLIKINQGYSNNETRHFQLLGAAFICSFAGYFVSATFVSVLYYSHYWYMTGLIVATKKIVQHTCSVQQNIAFQAVDIK